MVYILIWLTFIGSVVPVLVLAEKDAMVNQNTALTFTELAAWLGGRADGNQMLTHIPYHTRFVTMNNALSPFYGNLTKWEMMASLKKWSGSWGPKDGVGACLGKGNLSEGATCAPRAQICVSLWRKLRGSRYAGWGQQNMSWRLQLEVWYFAEEQWKHTHLLVLSGQKWRYCD